MRAFRPKPEYCGYRKTNHPGRMKNRFYLIAIAAVLILGLVPAARATTIYTTLGPGGSFDTNSYVEMGGSA